MLPGWDLSVVEKTCQYVKVTRLRPYGQHCAHDRAIWACYESCQTCGGSGCVDAANSRGWANCPDCFWGYRLIKTQEDLDRTIAAVVADFPEALAPEGAVIEIPYS